MMPVFMKNSLLLSYLFTTALNKNRFEKKFQIKTKIYIKVLILKYCKKIFFQYRFLFSVLKCCAKAVTT